MSQKLEVSNIVFTNKLSIDDLINNYAIFIANKLFEKWDVVNTENLYKKNINRLKIVSKTSLLDKQLVIDEIKIDISKLNSNDKNVIKTILSTYIKKIKVYYPNIEIHFKFGANIDDSKCCWYKKQKPKN